MLASISRWHREMAHGNQDKGLMHETLAAILGQWPESRTQLCPFQSVEGFDERCATRRWLKCGFTADSAVAEDFNKQGAPRLAEPTCFIVPLGLESASSQSCDCWVSMTCPRMAIALLLRFFHRKR